MVSSIRSKFVRGCFVGEELGGLARAKAGILISDVYTFLTVFTAHARTFCSFIAADLYFLV